MLPTHPTNPSGRKRLESLYHAHLIASVVSSSRRDVATCYSSHAGYSPTTNSSSSSPPSELGAVAAALFEGVFRDMGIIFICYPRQIGLAHYCNGGMGSKTGMGRKVLLMRG